MYKPQILGYGGPINTYVWRNIWLHIYIYMCNNYNTTNICIILKAQPPICTLFAAFESHNLASV